MRLGLGLSLSNSYRYTGGGTPAPAPALATIAAGGSYDGTAGSGYSGSPPAQGGVTGTRTIPGQPWFTHLGASTSGADNGVHSPLAWPVFRDGMLPDGPIHPDTGILAIYATDLFDGASVTFHLEGGEVTVGPDEQYPLEHEAWWGTETVWSYAARPMGLAHGQDFDWYATVTSPIVGTVDRVIGPIRQYVRTAPDAVVDVADKAALKAAIATAKTTATAGVNANAKWLKIRCTADIVCDHTSYGMSGAWTNARRGIVEIDANGFDLTFARPSGAANKGFWQPLTNGLVVNGAKFNLEQISTLVAENSTTVGTNDGFRPLALVNCDIYSTGTDELSEPGSIRTSRLIPHNALLIGSRLRDYATVTSTPCYNLGTLLSNITGDCFFFAGYISSTVAGGPSAVLNCRTENVTPGPWYDTPVQAFSWTGPADATLDITGAHNGNTRNFNFKIAGVTQGNWTASTTVSAGVGTGNYKVSDLVSWINSTLGGAGFSATLLDDTLRAAALGWEVHNPGAGWINTGITAGTVSATIVPHVDLVQYATTLQHDNTIVDGLSGIAVRGQIFPSLQNTNASAYNCFHRNIALAGNPITSMFQWQGKWRYSAFDHVSAPEQALILLYSISYTLPIDCYLRNGIFKSVTESGTPAGNLFNVSDIHAYDGGTLSGATDPTTGGVKADEFPGLVAPTGDPVADFALAGTGLTRTATPVARYDFRGRERGDPALLGALGS